MKVIKVKTKGRKFFLCRNRQLRTSIRRFRKGICFSCGKKKRLVDSVLFFSDKCKTHLNNERSCWIIDRNDYAWICRFCKKHTDQRLKLDVSKYDEAMNYIYARNENIQSVNISLVKTQENVENGA